MDNGGIMKRIAIAVLPLILAGCSSGTTLSQPPASVAPTPASTAVATPVPTATPVPSAASHLLTGLVTVEGLEYPQLSRCDPNSGYKDVNVGTNVVVKDGAGTIIGSGELALSPQAAPSDFAIYNADTGGFPCRLTYTMTVPDAAFYHIAIGRRDGPVDSAAQLTALGWVWDLSLGS